MGSVLHSFGRTGFSGFQMPKPAIARIDKIDMNGRDTSDQAGRKTKKQKMKKEEAAATAVVTDTGSESCTSTGPGSRKWQREFEARMNNRELQKIRAKEASAAKKAQAQRRAAETAGPGPCCIGPGSGRESDTATGEEL